MGTDSGEDKILLDENILKDLKLIMEDEFTEVLHVYLEESVGLMSKIHQAFEESPDSVARLAHALKSCSNNVGAVHLSKIAEEIRQKLMDDNLSAAEDTLIELEDVFTKTHAQVKKYLQNCIDKVA